jgi:hypothetical protein
MTSTRLKMSGGVMIAAMTSSTTKAWRRYRFRKAEEISPMRVRK